MSNSQSAIRNLRFSRGIGLMPTNSCFESGGSYEQCVASAMYTTNEHWAIPINAYDDEADTNPYVVGGAAWRTLHPAAAVALDQQSAKGQAQSVLPSNPLPTAMAIPSALPVDTRAAASVPIASGI